MKQIIIRTPCFEDWASMTPTEKGAFCSKCKLDVIDFTQQTPEEIRETLTHNFGKKVCGHLDKMQLELVNSNFHDWENQSAQILRSKFLYACLLVFGMSLFTGCENQHNHNTTDEVNGGLEVRSDDSSVHCNSDTLNGGVHTFTDVIKGQVEME